MVKLVVSGERDIGIKTHRYDTNLFDFDPRICWQDQKKGGNVPPQVLNVRQLLTAIILPLQCSCVDRHFCQRKSVEILIPAGVIAQVDRIVADIAPNVALCQKGNERHVGHFRLAERSQGTRYGIMHKAWEPL